MKFRQKKTQNSNNSKMAKQLREDKLKEIQIN